MLHRLVEERHTLRASGQVLAVPGRLSVAVVPDCARFSFRGDAAARSAAFAAFGCPLPERIGGVAVVGDRTALCLGPDEWFLLAPADDAGTVPAQFAAAVTAPHSLVDVSHREIGLDIAGEAAELALSAVCALDLRRMTAPFATRTILDRVPVVLIRHAPGRYRVEVWQSFADHLRDLLEAAAGEIALGV